MVALMGGVDSGKNSLLDVIAGRRAVGAISGMLLFNGECLLSILCVPRD
jgi:Fe-S cluster assembly ATPase SufC